MYRDGGEYLNLLGVTGSHPVSRRLAWMRDRNDLGVAAGDLVTLNQFQNDVDFQKFEFFGANNPAAANYMELISQVRTVVGVVVDVTVGVTCVVVTLLLLTLWPPSG